MDHLNKISNILKILIPTVTCLAFIKINSFYKQFDINVIDYIELTEYLTLFLDDLYTYLIICFVLFLVFYIPLGIYIVEDNTEHFKKILEMSFWKRMWSYLKFNITLVICVCILYYFSVDFKNSMIYYMLISTIVSIFIKEWIIKEYKIYQKVINPFYHNYIIFMVLTILMLNSTSVKEAEKIKINCTNALNLLVMEPSDTIEIKEPLIYLGKSNNYLFIYNLKTFSPVVFSESKLKVMVFKKK